MVNYQNSRVYKLVSDIDNKVYIGATTTRLCRRRAQHRSMAKIKPNRPVYKHFNEIGWDHVFIVLIEKYPCADKEELHKKERWYIDHTEATLNKQLPTRTDKEYRDDHCDEILQYRKDHRDEIIEYRKKLVICKCGREITYKNIIQHKRTAIHKKLILKK